VSQISTCLAGIDLQLRCVPPNATKEKKKKEKKVSNQFLTSRKSNIEVAHFSTRKVGRISQNHDVRTLTN